jgi:hypothetical protein
MLAFRYTAPGTGADVEIARPCAYRGISPSTSGSGAPPVVCWGVMPSGLLRHPVLIAAWLRSVVIVRRR